MDDAMRVFDPGAVRAHRERAAPRLAEHDFLLREVGGRLADRLDDVRRRFPLALDLGGRGGFAAELLAGRGGIETLVHADRSPALAAAAAAPSLAAEAEALPVADGAFDLVFSLLDLHWVNDLPGALAQVRRALKPDGLLLAAMFGGGTLAELRRALAEAELAAEGGVSPRVSPFADVRDAGNLLVRAGFALPVADAETLTVSYPDPLRLMADLRGMGETNAVRERRKGFSRRGTLLDAAARYRALYADADDRVPATFEIVTLTAWAPAASQPRPLRPGSAAARLADALETDEIDAGEAAGPRRRG